MFEALKSGTIGDYYDELAVDGAEVERGVAGGRLVVDTRLRDALRQLRDPAGEGYLPPGEAPALRFPLPTLVEDAEYAVEAAVLGEADVVRLQRRLDTLEQRLASIELRLPNRIYRKLTRPVKRALGRGGADGAAWP
jgi:tetrahydromethanopterin S-methyltransferase subunit G